MRILLLGNITGSLDEGMKNTTYSLYRALSADNEVLVVHPRQVFRPSVVRDIRRFRPEIMHYVHGPSMRSLVALRWAAALAGGARTVASATQPRLAPRVIRLLPFLKADLVLIQSVAVEQYLVGMGFVTRMAPSGVDLERFCPVSPTRKTALRQHYGLPDQKRIVLHVGSVRRSRNVQVLAQLQAETDYRFLMAGGTTEGPDAEMEAELRAAGVLVWTRFFPQIEHLFQLADCYLFPVVEDLGCIQFPLSVLEAAACNLPIVTTPFGGLPTFLPAGQGLHYATTPAEMKEALVDDALWDGVATRALAERFSWAAVAQMVLGHYRTLLKGP